MAVEELPLALPPDGTAATEVYSLSGETYGIRIGWNRRAAIYYLDLLDASGAPIAAGIAVNGNVPLLYGRRLRAGAPWPPGDLIVTGGRGGGPGLGELGEGKRWRMAYVARDE